MLGVEASADCCVLACCRRVQSLVGHKAEISSAQFNWDCSLIATGSMDKTCKLWDVGSGVCVSVYMCVCVCAGACAVQIWKVFSVLYFDQCVVQYQRQQKKNVTIGATFGTAINGS